MPPPHRFRAPAANGAVLADPGFDAVPALVEANRRRLDRPDVVVGGLPLPELRELARQEVCEAAGGFARPDAPLLIAGHQPELSHPGVWVKHFALNGLARKVGGVPLNLIVDNDTLKSTSLRFPAFHDLNPGSAHLESVAFDRLDRETPYEDRMVTDLELFNTFPERASRLWRNWGYEPLLRRIWPDVVDHPMRSIGEKFTAVRRKYEQNWGCRNAEAPVSDIGVSEAFVRFVQQITNDLPRFRAAHNLAIRQYRRANRIRSRNHPAPELDQDGAWYEAPFWVQFPSYLPATDGRARLFVRRLGNRVEWRADGSKSWGMPASADEYFSADDYPLTIHNIPVRPRALTLTLFARVCLGDFFIHGIGGGKYDEVTDAIIRDYFGIEPPAYQVLSATLHLPLPGFASTAADVQQAERHVRDLAWNPQRHLSPEDAARPEVAALVREKTALAAAEPPSANHAARGDWFRALARDTERLRPLVGEQVAAAEVTLARTRAEAHANAVLRRRDYSWVLYPEETLRPFLQRFLDQ